MNNKKSKEKQARYCDKNNYLHSSLPYTKKIKMYQYNIYLYMYKYIFKIKLFTLLLLMAV